jgi:mannose-6-phosphate isomerase-like protein (cupin superfamily)
MAAIEVKNIGTPDETRTFDHGKLEVVTLSGMVFGKATFEPGWRWSQSVKPIAGTDSCQVHHNGYVLSGRMHVTMDDGSEGEAGAGDVLVIPPGHDAWTVGDEPCIVFDFSSQIAQYAKQ